MAVSDDTDQPVPGPGVRLPGLRHNPEGSMPLMEHIRELRNRVVKMALFMVVGAIAGWYLYPHIWHFIEAPYCRLDLTTHVQVTGGGAKGCQLFVTGIFDAFFLRLKIAIIAGVILSSPLWLYQFWAFLAPGLYARERRWAYFFAGSAVPLFAIGSALAYFAMTKGLHFLLLLVPHNVVPIITINTYLGYAIAMLTIFGIAFELPLGFVLLNVAGVLTHQRFAKWRRMIIFGVFLFAAVATLSRTKPSGSSKAMPKMTSIAMA
jgi:sec-independent protein translocase protein TatC